MDINQISQLISAVGFPIIACIIMWKTLQDSTEAHKEEIDALRESLNKNTMILTELKQLIQDMNPTKARTADGSIYSAKTGPGIR